MMNRRSFLKGVAALASSAAIPASAGATGFIAGGSVAVPYTATDVLARQMAHSERLYAVIQRDVIKTLVLDMERVLMHGDYRSATEIKERQQEKSELFGIGFQNET